jgi:hypothetical protein
MNICLEVGLTFGNKGTNCRSNPGIVMMARGEKEARISGLLRSTTERIYD